MKTHTNNYKEEIKKFGRDIDSKITYGQTELGKEVLNSVSPHYQSSLLKSVMKQLDIDSNVDIPLETELNYQFGVKVGNAYEYVDFGNYIVYSSEKQEDTNSYKITCYDKMLYAMKPYESLNVTYPITIRDYLIAICDKLGLDFANENDTFVNYDKQIANELYLDADGNSLDYTFRDVLDELSQVTASVICINKDDKLEIRYVTPAGQDQTVEGTTLYITNALQDGILYSGINNITQTNNDLPFVISLTYADDTQGIDEEYLKDVNVNFGEKYGPVNSVVLSRSAESDSIYQKDDESIEQNGLTEIKIKDNQILNGNNRDEFLPQIFSQLNGFEYYLNDYSSTGITYYDLMDRYNVTIGENTYSCVMFNDEINVTQGLEENVYSERLEMSETDYTKSDKTDRKINQAYIIVDKQNQQINSVVQNVNTLQSMVNSQGEQINALGTRITQDINTITASVTTIQGELNDGVNLVKTTSVTIDDTGLTVETDTSKTTTTMTSDKFAINSSGTELAFFGYDEETNSTKAEMNNLTVTKYFVAGYHRTEAMPSEQRTGVFYIGG